MASIAEAVDDPVGVAVTGHRAHVEPEGTEGVHPLSGHDRHAVGRAEPEGDEGAGRHVASAWWSTGVAHNTSGRRRTRIRSISTPRHAGDGGALAPRASPARTHETYPWQWLWDSCFHSIVWASLGDERAVVELGTVFDGQDLATGFVPHMTYWDDPLGMPTSGDGSGTASITQPPMYGHAVRALVDRGSRCAGAGRLGDARPVVPAARSAPFAGGPGRAGPPVGVGGRRQPSVGRPRRRPVRAGPLVPSARASWSRPSPATPAARPIANRRRAGRLGRLRRPGRLQRDGSSPSVTGDEVLDAAGVELGQAVALPMVRRAADVDRRRADRRRARVARRDARGPARGARRRRRGARPMPCSGRCSIPTATRRVVRADGRAPRRTDLRTVHVLARAGMAPAHLPAVGGRRSSRAASTSRDRLAWALRAGAARSGFAEYWHPDTGEGLGAMPQSWTAARRRHERRSRVTGSRRSITRSSRERGRRTGPAPFEGPPPCSSRAIASS